MDAARDDHSALLLVAIPQKTGFAKRYEVRLVAKSFTIDNVSLDGPETDIISHSDMVRSFLWLSFRFSPTRDMARTEIPGQLEHFIACAGSKSSR